MSSPAWWGRLNDGSMLDPLNQFVIGDPDGGCDGPPLLCQTCQETICTVEFGDDLDVLIRTVLGHECGD